MIGAPEWNRGGFALIKAIERLMLGISSCVGVTLNEKYLAEPKNLIGTSDTLNIPENYEYNVTELVVDGVIDCDGVINIID